MADFVLPPIQIPATLMEDLTTMGAFLDVGSRAHDVALEMIRRLHEDLAGAPFGSNYRMLAYVLFSKGFMTFQAARNLYILGCGPDALGLCASLFENVVDLTFIRQAPVRRSNRYIRFEQVDKYYQIEKVCGGNGCREERERGTNAT